MHSAAMGPIQLRLCGRSAIATASLPAAACDCNNTARFLVHAPNAVVFCVHYVDAAIALNANPFRLMKRGLQRRSAIPRIPLLSRPGDRADDTTARIDLANAVTFSLADIDIACRVNSHSAGAVNGSARGRT